MFCGCEKFLNGKKDFENYISLGYFCHIAIDLEKLGLRNASYPFDWVISDFEMIVYGLMNNFTNFLEYENLCQYKTNLNWYYDEFYKMSFFHDFSQYKSLKDQIDMVSKKYRRRIDRLLNDINKPTLFFRYIDSERLVNGKSKELIYIENNYLKIINLIKSFNKENEIVFIANESCKSDKLFIFNVIKDNGDVVNRSPLFANEKLSSLVSKLKTYKQAINLKRYNNQVIRRAIFKIPKKIKKIGDNIFKLKYYHNKQF